MGRFESFFGRRVLITGGGGFIASRTAVRLLSAGADVHLLLKPETSSWRLPSGDEETPAIHRGDCTDASDVRRIIGEVAPDLVYHFAVPRLRGMRGWKALMNDCIGMALNLAEILPDAGNPPLVVSGSSLEYGPNIRPHCEDDPLSPITWHGLGKSTALGVFRQAAGNFGLRFTNLRFFHVYGPWESPHRLLCTAIRSALTGVPLPVVEGTIRRDWVYIDDVVEACLAAGSVEPSCESFNIGSGRQYTNEFVVGTVEKICGRPIKREAGGFPPSPSDSPFRLADISKAERGLNWIPRVSLEDGVSATVDWLVRHPDILKDRPGYRPVHA